MYYNDKSLSRVSRNRYPLAFLSPVLCCPRVGGRDDRLVSRYADLSTNLLEATYKVRKIYIYRERGEGEREGLSYVRVMNKLWNPVEYRLRIKTSCWCLPRGGAVILLYFECVKFKLEWLTTSSHVTGFWCGLNIRRHMLVCVPARACMCVRVGACVSQLDASWLGLSHFCVIFL